MTGRRWREEVERLMTSFDDIHKTIETVHKMESTKKENEDTLNRLLQEKAEAQLELCLIRDSIESFKKEFLNRETCDDFDEIPVTSLMEIRKEL